MKKSFVYALSAIVYIISIVLVINYTGSSSLASKEETILIPMIMLSLFVISTAIMGFLFLSEPIILFMDNRKKEAVAFFGKTLGFFIFFALLLGISFLLF